jgi:hypothetical protein
METKNIITHMSKLQARNETIINAPVNTIWRVITDINLLHKVNPGVIKATGTMNHLNATRNCEIDNKGKIGTMKERLIEIIPEKCTVWTIESDDMGMSKMLKDTRFCFNLEKVSDSSTKVVAESYYRPANLVASIMNRLMIRRTITNAQQKILENLKLLTKK